MTASVRLQTPPEEHVRAGTLPEGVRILPLSPNVDPRGIVHGWYFHEASVHVQAVSETYPEYREDDNLGCRWSDPDLGIPWPETPRIVAPRAAAFLRALIEESLRRDPQLGS